MTTPSPLSTNTETSNSLPSSSSHLFDKLKHLQELIKQEAMQKEIVIDIREKMFQQMEKDLFSIVENKIKFSEKIDDSNQDGTSINYILERIPNHVYKDETMYITKIMNFLRKYQDFLYRLLIQCSTDQEKKCLSNLIANFFYINILSSNSIEDEYLFLIYRLLKYEIDLLEQTNTSDAFLNNSICSYLLQHLICNDNIKVYFGKILNEIIEKIDNKEDNNELEFDPTLIEAKLEDKKQLQKKKKDTYTDTISKSIMTSDINKNECLFGNEPIEQGYPFLYEKENPVNQYIADLTVNEIQSFFTKTGANKTLNEYIEKQINEINKTKNEKLFTNDEFLSIMFKLNETEVVLKIFQKYYFTIIEIITRIIYNLNKNISIIPDSLRYVSKIIAILLKKKFPSIIDVELNGFIAVFVFKLIMKPLFIETNFNSLLTSKLLTQTTKNNVVIINFIFDQLVSGNFFKSTEFPHYTSFNRYFIDIMPKTLEFFENLLNVELPSFLQKIIKADSTSIDDSVCKNYVYDYLNEKPGETMHYTTVCITPEQVITIHKLIVNIGKDYFPNDIPEHMKGDFAFFKGSINKLKDHDHMVYIENAKLEDEESNPKKLSFIVLKELKLCNQLKTMEKLKKGYFSIKEIDTPSNDEDKNKNILIKVKNALSEILFNIHDIPEANFFGTAISNTEQFINTLLQIIKIDSYTLDNPVQTEWYILSLKQLLPKLSDYYKQNDYEKVYDELVNDVENSINNIDIGIFTKIKNKTRYTIKELIQTKNYLENIENVEFNKKIQDFLDNGKIDVTLTIPKSSKKKKLIIESTDSGVSTKFKYLDNFLFDKKDKGNIIDTIQKFIIRFPNIAKGRSEDEVFDMERSLEVPEALVTYYDFVKKAIKDYVLSKEKIILDENIKKKEKNKKDKENELERIKDEELRRRIENDIERIFKSITNYIMTKIYDKLFPQEYDFKDVKIHQQCVMLSWVEPEHIGKIPKINTENFLPASLNLISQLDAIKNPYEKMAVFSKVSEIILNTLNFCVGKVEGGVDDTLPLLLFVVIKAQPKSFASNMRFIELYYHDLGQGPDSQRFAILMAIEERLINFSHTDLINVSEEEYIQRCAQQ